MGTWEAWPQFGAVSSSRGPADLSHNELAFGCGHVSTHVPTRSFPTGVFLEGERAVPADPQMRQVSEPWCRLGPQRPQTVLPVERLCLRQVHFDCGKAACYGRAGGAEEAAGSRRIGSAGARISVHGKFGFSTSAPAAPSTPRTTSTTSAFKPSQPR